MLGARERRGEVGGQEKALEKALEIRKWKRQTAIATSKQAWRTNPRNQRHNPKVPQLPYPSPLSLPLSHCHTGNPLSP